MNSSITKLFTFAAILAALVFATGCADMLTGHASAISIKVVDSKTSQPLPGVSAIWREDLDDVGFGHFQTGPTNLPPSDNSGVITISLVHPKMTGRLILSRFGYTTVYGIYSDGSLNTSDNIEPPPLPQDLFMLDEAQTSGHVNGSFLVRMHQ